LPLKAGVKVASIFAVVNPVLAPLEVESRGVPRAKGLRAPFDRSETETTAPDPDSLGLPPSPKARRKPPRPLAAMPRTSEGTPPIPGSTRGSATP